MSINLQFPAKFNIYLMKYVIRRIEILKTEEEDTHLPPYFFIASAANQRPDDFNLFGH